MSIFTIILLVILVVIGIISDLLLVKILNALHIIRIEGDNSNENF